MKNLLFMMIVAVNTVALVGCSKDDPAPMPQSGFVVSKTLIESGEVVSFTNNSQNAIRYEWDFGNGQSATIQNPTMQYNQPGSYVVSLSAFNEDNQAQVSTIIVKVGERYLKSITVKSINFLDPDGQAWDVDGSGPDLAFIFDVKGSFNYYTDISFDIHSGSLPVTLTPENPVKLTDAEWDFTLWDYDDDLNGSEKMANWPFNPTRYGANGKINTAKDIFEMEITYEIR